ncbi:MAG: hypothetical protein EOP48_13745 [Sphingobacteriales bacterium]|nr:MAG: hypothetical protein EOP48_13745 [Sphingobacteriales bacterium]
MLITSCTDTGQPKPPDKPDGKDTIPRERPRNTRIYDWQPVFVVIKDSANSKETLALVARAERRIYDRIAELNKGGKARFVVSLNRTLLTFDDKTQAYRIEPTVMMKMCWPCTPPPPTSDLENSYPEDSGQDESDND